MRRKMAFLLREFHYSSREFSMLLRDRIGPMHYTVGTLVAAALRLYPDDPVVRLGSQALTGQIMSFGACWSAVCARLEWDDYTRDHIDLIASTLIPATPASLGLPPRRTRTEGILS